MASNFSPTGVGTALLILALASAVVLATKIAFLKFLGDPSLWRQTTYYPSFSVSTTIHYFSKAFLSFLAHFSKNNGNPSRLSLTVADVSLALSKSQILSSQGVFKVSRGTLT